MDKFNKPSEQEFMDYLGMKESKRKELQDRADKESERLDHEAYVASDPIALARQYAPFRKKLQEAADVFLGKWLYLEPGTEVQLEDEPSVLTKPLILYGKSMTMRTRCAIGGTFYKDLVGKDGKVVELSFDEMRLMDQIRLEVVILRDTIVNVVPNILFTDIGLDSLANMTKMLDYHVDRNDPYSRLFHVFKKFQDARGKEKCIEYLRANKERILDTLKTGREDIIKAYDYITENIGSDKFDGEEVQRLFRIYQ
jgi:hypothetical protein